MDDKSWNDYLNGVNTGTSYNIMSELGASHHRGPQPLQPTPMGVAGSSSESREPGPVGKVVFGSILALCLFGGAMTLFGISLSTVVTYWSPGRVPSSDNVMVFTLVAICLLVGVSVLLGRWAGFALIVLLLLPCLPVLTDQEPVAAIIAAVVGSAVPLFLGLLAYGMADWGADLRADPGYLWASRKRYQRGLIGTAGVLAAIGVGAFTIPVVFG